MSFGKGQCVLGLHLFVCWKKSASMVSECVRVSVRARSALREWAYPSLVAQNILIYWLPVSPPRHLSPSLLRLCRPVTVALGIPGWSRKLQNKEDGREWRRREQKRHKVGQGCPIWVSIQQPFNQGPYIIQIYEVRSRPNQNLDLSVRVAIYKPLVVGSGYSE